MKRLHGAFALLLVFSIFIFTACDSYDGHVVNVTVDDGFVYFGEYPQSLVSQSLIEELEDYVTNSYNNKYSLNPIKSNSNSYYTYFDIEYNDSKYRCIKFNSDNFNQYQSENRYKADKRYWFKWEPIKWEIVDEDDESYFLLSTIALYSNVFDNYYSANEYSAYEWLSDELMNSAFTYDEYTIINNDIGLLSCEEINYYFSMNSQKKRLSSDYAKAFGCYSSDENATRGYCKWWTKTYYDSDSTYIINQDGSLYISNNNSSNIGIVPKIQIIKQAGEY